MGFIFSKSMNENMKNQQEFMVMHARLQSNKAKEASFSYSYSSPKFHLHLPV
ncbi:similar to RIKEN cDNA 5033414D02 (predicted), isoform CRA_b [Rattus norvegicus]|uniref:Similar to RIKEN cDNA 5033414D02 (Predicted), isoform CRA_b n=1 Tax=Rattus norvegicus TaxID=10116 RepID=A6I0W3_RAT|nr:similar to RIKEN cDNA 5033414D02 (predicted), isoform CRA_b [Rattus norvegicus]